MSITDLKKHFCLVYLPLRMKKVSFDSFYGPPHKLKTIFHKSSYISIVDFFNHFLDLISIIRWKNNSLPSFWHSVFPKALFFNATEKIVFKSLVASSFLDKIKEYQVPPVFKDFPIEINIKATIKTFCNRNHTKTFMESPLFHPLCKKKYIFKLITGNNLWFYIFHAIRWKLFALLSSNLLLYPIDLYRCKMKQCTKKWQRFVKVWMINYFISFL